MTSTEITQPFRPRARLLQLLGDELIGSPRLAVFELVKNAYDADADTVAVRLDLASSTDPSITVIDDGQGMTPNVLTSVWLVPGDDHRRGQRERRERSAKHHRLPLGEKGVGRFAAHKLGNLIRLTTRARESPECVVEIDWNELTAKPFLDEAPVTIRLRTPEVFTGTRTGTSIEVRELKPPAWTRRDIRGLYNQITSICSPFQQPGEFNASLEVPGHEHWIEDLPDIVAIVGRAIWRFTFLLKDGRFDYTYEFRQIPGLNLDSRKVSKEGDTLRLPPLWGGGRLDKKVVADVASTRDIGPVSGEFYVFDRDRKVLHMLGDLRVLANYLDENGGIRVYRDGIRVYNYGEQGDDWLGLDLRRVNVPTRRISRNIILGAIHLSLEASSKLVEKTNREGFVENDACRRLRQVVLAAVFAFEEHRQLDKDRIRQLLGEPTAPPGSRIEEPIQKLRGALKDHGMDETFEPYVGKIERDYSAMQETLLAAGMSGLNLAVVFHEVERGVRALHQVIVEGRDIDSAARQAQELMSILDGFSTLLRRDSVRQHTARKLLATAFRFNSLRFRHHRIQFTCPLLHDGEGFAANFSFGLVLGALNNLLDNALYWLRVRWPTVPEPDTAAERRLLVDAYRDERDRPAIIVADNGVGFQGDMPEHLMRPFFTRKPDGMGLGLYYANLAMELNGGHLEFPHRNDVNLPDQYDGAIVSMVFKGAG